MLFSNYNLIYLNKQVIVKVNLKYIHVHFCTVNYKIHFFLLQLYIIFHGC